MEYRYLGKTGLNVSVLSLGTWITFSHTLNQSSATDIVGSAFDQGINIFDTAEVYGEGKAETVLGNAIQANHIPREQYLLCSKVFWGGSNMLEIGLTRKHIFSAVNHSLKRLQVDYLDLYLCHRPDPNTSIEETVIAMNLLIQQGKILYWGTSEWKPEQILEAYYISKQMSLIGPSVEQFEYNMFQRENAEITYPLIKEKTNIGSLTTMPLANGILSGKYNYSIPVQSRACLDSHPCFIEAIESRSGAEKIQITKQLAILAEQLQISIAQLALSWCLKNTNITSIILGVSSKEQLLENIKSIDVLNNKLNDDGSIMNKIEDILKNKPGRVYQPSYAEVIAES